MHTPYRHAQALGSPLGKRLVDRLDAVLTAMAYCKGAECRNPWGLLHPDGAAGSMLEAMSAAFDGFYSQRTKFSFRLCDTKYDPANEVADATIRSRFNGGFQVSQVGK